MDNRIAARAEAEAGIARSDKAIGEALRKGSPLSAYLTRYVAQRAAYAACAARLQGAIERKAPPCAMTASTTNRWSSDCTTASSARKSR